MSTNRSRRWLAGALAGVLLGAIPAAFAAEDSAKAQAQRQLVQPYNNAPVWREVRSGQAQTTQVRGIETNVLVQTEGEVWRQIHNGPLTIFGGMLVLAVPLLLFWLYRWRGAIKVRDKLTGRKIQRLSTWDRTIHWTNAIAWLVLAISGLTLLFGKYVVLPVVGYTLFSWLGIFAKNLHNFVGPVFLVTATLMFVQYVGRNIPHAYDLKWLANLGGVFSGTHAPAGFFNGGEKVVFWIGLTLFTIVAGGSGLVMLFPNFNQGREIMQYANLVHATTAVLYIAMMTLHIYLGTVGVEGAYEAMRYHGQVDEQWAREHHEYWYNEVKAGTQGSAAPLVGMADRRR